MSWRRLVPAAVLGPLLLWAAAQEVVPGYLVALGLCAAIGSGELYLLLAQAAHRPCWALGLPLAVALAADAALTGWRLFPQLGAFLTVASLGWATFRRKPAPTLSDWALTLTPPLYVGALLGYYALLRQRPDGAFWVQLVLGCTWAADTGAYLVGRRWGRTRLAPTLSPAKSVEGALGGLAGSAGLAVVVALVAPGARGSLPLLVGLGLLVGVAGPTGDLVESWIKRQLGAKDASGLLLGHGGLLDRMDSLLATGMVAYYYLATLGG
jgi:phosphatidate cytidylyltransferase